MYSLEMCFFAVITVLSLVALSAAWVCEKLRICDEFTLAAQMVAPKLTRTAAWLLFVCYVASILPGDGITFWRICGYIVIYSELLSLFKELSAAGNACRIMKDYYTMFERDVLLGVNGLSQYDFNQTVKSVIEQKLSHDVNCASYFSLKCRKFADNHGLMWEE